MQSRFRTFMQLKSLHILEVTISRRPALTQSLLRWWSVALYSLIKVYTAVSLRFMCEITEIPRHGVL